jgi:hypothetical protein
MSMSRRIVLHSLSGYRPELDALVQRWMEQGVKYVGVVGVDASRIEDAIDDLCIGNGERPYFMVTAAHDADESLADALMLARHMTEICEGEGEDEVVIQMDDPVEVIEF